MSSLCLRAGPFLLAASTWAVHASAQGAPARVLSADTARWAIEGRVQDSASNAPLPGATVVVSKDHQLVRQARADSAGSYHLRLSGPGAYVMSVRRLGYAEQARTVTLDTPAHVGRVDFRLSTVASRLETVIIAPGAPVAIEGQTGNQAFDQQDYHGSPTQTTSQIVQQAIAGAARAPTGEVHIRGQHAEYTYYIDGVPVPQGIGGSLNELFDPAIVDRIGFQTGGWDAEYGNQNIAIINVQTKIPDGGFHGEASAYAGSFASDGANVLASTNDGPWGFLVSGTRDETEMRREPVEANAQGVPLNFHNSGEDQYGFGKVEYTPSTRDVVTLDIDASQTHAGVPYDSTYGVINDYETDVNGFANLALRHVVTTPTGGRAPSVLFASLYLRRSTLDYVPGPHDQPQFLLYPDTTNAFNIQEHRAATTVGTKIDYAFSPVRQLTLKSGIEASLVEGHENFSTVDSLQQAGPSINTGVRGGDADVYAQSVFDPSPHWELRTGVRLDHHVAPIAGDTHQVSPRIRLNWYPDTATMAYGYYGRLFIPSNVEDFHVLAAAGTGKPGVPTVPERDNYYETGVAHRFGGGVVGKFDGYFRDDGPAIDDNVLPGTTVDATVNIAKVHVTGLESALELHPAGPFSGYVNAALSHASAHGPVTGGFFPTPYPSGWFDQDHDQRLSIVANGEYARGIGYVSLTGIFGSGLTNGDPEAAPNHTGLFDFNPGVKVPPNYVFDPSAGTFLTIDRMPAKIEVFVDNALNRRYILKGAFTSGPSIGRPRSVQLRVTLDTPPRHR